MSLAQYKVNSCKDCPFLSEKSDIDYRECDFYQCNIKDNIIITDKTITPDWCPLMESDFIEVLHVDK